MQRPDDLLNTSDYAAIGARLADEMALQRWEHMFRTLAESMRDAFVSVDMQGKIRQYNRSFQELLGYSDEELAQLTYEDITPPQWHAIEERIVQEQILPQGYSAVYEKEYRRKDGTIFPIELRTVLVHDSQGQPNGMWAIIRDITARKQAEEALHASERNLQHFLNNSPDTIYVLDLMTNTSRFLNRDSFLGYSRYELEAKGSLSAAVHPDDLPAVMEQWNSITTTQADEPASIHYRVKNRQGDWEWLQQRVTVLARTEQGVPHMLLITLSIITTHKRAEQALRANQARQAFLLELNDQLRPLADPKSIQRVAAYTLGKYFQASCVGYAEEQAYGQTILVGCPYTDGGPSIEGSYRNDKFGSALLRDLWASQTVVREDIAADPMLSAEDKASYANLQIGAIVNLPILKANRLRAVLFMYSRTARTWSHDELDLLEETVERIWAIVERERAEAAQRAYAARLQQLTAASLLLNTASTRDDVFRLTAEQSRMLIGAHQAVVSTTADQSWVQMINAISRSSTNPPKKDSIGTLDASNMYALVCRTNRPMRLTHADLEAHPILRGIDAQARIHPPLHGWLAVPLVGRDGRNLGLIQLSDKIEGEFTSDDEALLVQLAQVAAIALENQQLYAKEQLARAEAEKASRLKDEFLATVSHELRTPLTSFLGYAQLLQRRTHDEAYVRRTVEQMVKSARTQAALIEDLLDVSRIVSGKLRIEPRPIELINVIQAALDTVRPALEAKSLYVALDLDPAGSTVLGDANRLQQMVWNLISNATKFTPSGGQITIRLAVAGGHAELRVSDTGQGIPPDFLPYIFDRFRQADSSTHRVYGGLGLGLAIVRHLVELHGGTVEATSAGVGQGATFTVHLPLARVSDVTSLDSSPRVAVTQPEEVAQPEEESFSLRGLRILIVDDQPVILDLLAEILTSEGAAVRTCTTAREALALLRAWQPDVLLSDIAMPDEDGYWLIQHVRSLAPEEGGTIPAVALTAHARKEDRLRAFTAGFQQYVPKPVDDAELRNVILQLVSKGLQR